MRRRDILRTAIIAPIVALFAGFAGRLFCAPVTDSAGNVIEFTYAYSASTNETRVYATMATDGGRKIIRAARHIITGQHSKSELQKYVVAFFDKGEFCDIPRGFKGVSSRLISSRRPKQGAERGVGGSYREEDLV